MPMHASSLPPCLCSLLSGCLSSRPPVLLHSQCPHFLGAGILLPVGAQYQPFSIIGWKSLRSQPSCRNILLKLDSREITLEVAFSAPCPDVVEVLLLNQALDPVFLSLCLNGDRVHAELPAVVSGTLPVPLSVFANSQPGKVIVLVKSGSVDDSCNMMVTFSAPRFFLI